MNERVSEGAETASEQASVRFAHRSKRHERETWSVVFDNRIWRDGPCVCQSVVGGCECGQPSAWKRRLQHEKDTKVRSLLQEHDPIRPTSSISRISPVSRRRERVRFWRQRTLPTRQSAHSGTSQHARADGVRLQRVPGCDTVGCERECRVVRRVSAIACIPAGNQNLLSGFRFCAVQPIFDSRGGDMSR